MIDMDKPLTLRVLLQLALVVSGGQLFFALLVGAWAVFVWPALKDAAKWAGPRLVCLRRGHDVWDVEATARLLERIPASTMPVYTERCERCRKVTRQIVRTPEPLKPEQVTQ